MRYRGSGLDLLRGQKDNRGLDTHIEIEDVGSAWYVYCGDVKRQSVEMSLMTWDRCQRLRWSARKLEVP